MGTAKSKREIGSSLNQFDNVLHVEITTVELSKCTGEQILKSMRKAPLGNGLEGVEDVLETIIYALTPPEPMNQLQEETGN